jgi:hypothetical protein
LENQTIIEKIIDIIEIVKNKSNLVVIIPNDIQEFVQELVEKFKDDEKYNNALNILYNLIIDSDISWNNNGMALVEKTRFQMEPIIKTNYYHWIFLKIKI